MQKCNSVEKVPVWWTAHDELEARTEAFNSLGSQETLTGGAKEIRSSPLRQYLPSLKHESSAFHLFISDTNPN